MCWSYFRGVGTPLLLLALLSLTPVVATAEKAPDFNLADEEGRQVSLSDYAGSPLVLHFWASWCPYCKKLQPGLDALAIEYEKSGIVLLGINFREDEGVNPQAVLRQRGMHFKTLVRGDEAARSYAVRGTPTTFFIDSQGHTVGVTNTSDPNDPVLRALANKAMGRAQ
jgi:cytochrome c biogenesis protein CcmG/thiol:disulfide interchange protein DsbE